MNQPTSYRHTQSGKFIWLILLIGLFILAIAITVAGIVDQTMIVVTIVSIAISFLLGWMFGSLTVSISGGLLNWWFGPGFWRKKVPVHDIAACEAVRNYWWWGWGIRYYTKGWLYSISGLDAVELRLKSGKFIRIGTDQPEKLVMALLNHPEWAPEA